MSKDKTEKVNIPLLDTSRSATYDAKSLPNIRPSSTRAKIIVTDPEGKSEMYRNGAFRNRSNSMGAEDAFAALQKKTHGASLLNNIIPISSASNFTDGKQEIEKAYAMTRALRKENEEYHKELLRERETNSKYSLYIKELEHKVSVHSGETQTIRDSLAFAEEKIRELEHKLSEERKQSKEALHNLLNREKNLQGELSRAIKTTDVLNSQLNVLLNRISFKDLSVQQQNKEEAEPPIGKVALVFTDVENSTEKWEKDPEVMQECLSLHNALIREKIKEYKGYEVKTEGDSFMIAFPTAASAARFALSVQSELLNIPWPEALLKNWKGCKEYRLGHGKSLLWRGLRVRMGLHMGLPTCAVDPVTGRMDYLGTTVNKASRITAMAAGGQILLSAEMWEEIQEDMLDLKLDIKDVGSYTLKGLSERTSLRQILPIELAERSFPPPMQNFQSNGLERQLQSLLKENERLKTHLNSLEEELNQIITFSGELEKEYQNVNLKRSLSQESLEKLLQASNLNETLLSQFTALKTKMSSFHDETEEMRKTLSNVIHQKNRLSDERNSLLQRISDLETEKIKLLDTFRDLQTPPTSLDSPRRNAEFIDKGKLPVAKPRKGTKSPTGRESSKRNQKEKTSPTPLRRVSARAPPIEKLPLPDVSARKEKKKLSPKSDEETSEKSPGRVIRSSRSLGAMTTAKEKRDPMTHERIPLHPNVKNFDFDSLIESQ